MSILLLHYIINYYSAYLPLSTSRRHDLQEKAMYTPNAEPVPTPTNVKEVPYKKSPPLDVSSDFPKLFGSRPNDHPFCCPQQHSNP